MLRRLFVAGLLSGSLMAASGSAPAQASVSVDVNLHFGSDHQFWFDNEPRFVSVPHSVVYYSAGPECDVYRYGDWYYVNNGYDWYRSCDYGGPFARIAYIAVPRPIVVIPSRYRRYAGHVVTRDPWANRWRDSSTRWQDDGHYGRNDGGNDGRYDRRGNDNRDNDARDDSRWSHRDRDDRSDDRWAQKGHGNGKGKGHGKNKGHGKPGRDVGHS